MGGKLSKKSVLEKIPSPDARSRYSPDYDIWYIPLSELREDEPLFLVIGSKARKDVLEGAYISRSLADIHLYNKKTSDLPDDYRWCLTERSVLGFKFDVKNKKYKMSGCPIKETCIYSSLPRDMW